MLFYTFSTWFKCLKLTKLIQTCFSNIRFPLLSEKALEYVLEKVSLFSESNDCVNSLKTVLVNKIIDSQNKSSIYYKSRYCKQNKYNLFICGGYDNRLGKYSSEVQQIDRNNVNNVKCLTQMSQCRKNFEAVSLKCEIYVLVV